MKVGFYDMPGHSLGALTSRLATDASRVCSMVGTSWGELSQFISYVDNNNYYYYVFELINFE